LLQIIVKVDDAVFAKKVSSSTIFTFFTKYEIKHLSCGDECNPNKVRALLHPSVSNDNFSTNFHDQKAHLVVFELHFLLPTIQLDGHVHTRATSPPCLQKPL
jgi:hypothetical protein